jgi:hypothetical protein
MRNGSERREVTQMGKSKKLIAAALAIAALAAIPSTSVALSDGSEGVKVACQGGSGSSGCYG